MGPQLGGWAMGPREVRAVHRGIVHYYYCRVRLAGLEIREIGADLETLGPENFDLDFKPQLQPKEWEDWQVNISILTEAVKSGAVCLDGSPPAYFLDRGSGEGADNWVVFFEGGGWCNSDASCLARASTAYGSSKHMPSQNTSQAFSAAPQLPTRSSTTGTG